MAYAGDKMLFLSFSQHAINVKNRGHLILINQRVFDLEINGKYAFCF